MAAPLLAPGDPPEIHPPTERTPLSHERELKPARGNCLASVQLAVASSAGLFADGYDLQTMNLSLAIMHLLYPGEMNAGAMSFAASTMLAGVVVGQVLFGTLADTLGHRWVSITTASLTVMGAALSSTVTTVVPVSLSVQLGTWRFFLGLGIGGEYPLSAAISQEANNKSLCCTRGQMLTYNIIVFNFGALVQAFLVLSMNSLAVPLCYTWRVALAAGALPSLIAAFLRLMMHEPDPHTIRVSRGEGAARSFLANFHLHVRNRWSIFLGACMAWALFNATSYGHGAFFSIVAKRILGNETTAAKTTVQQAAIFALMTRGAAMASCLLGLFLESRLSRRQLQLFGFSAMAVPLWLVGVLFGRVPDSWDWLIVALYLTLVFMMSFVGISTYLVPAEYLPAPIRGTCVGIAAASGKAGAILGTALFPLCEHSFGLSAVMMISGVLSLLGVLVTWLLTPSANPEERPAAKEMAGELAAMKEM